MSLATENLPALRDVFVLSVGHTLPGLQCLSILRDLGARVIRIERPVSASGDGDKYRGMDVTFPIRSLTFGTHEIALDLKQAQGISIFGGLAKRADVLLEGFRPGVMQRLGIDYHSLRHTNPGLVYAAITGYGQQGDYRDKAGHDINYLAETGVLALTNPPGLPGATYADGMAGVSAALNVVAALLARAHTGLGQMIDCAIVDGPLSLMASEFEYCWKLGEARGAGATHLTGSHPWYGLYQTSDGRQVAIGAVEPQFYQVLCHRLGLPELATRQQATGPSLDQARTKFAEAVARHRLADVLRLFEDHPACVSPVRHTDEVLASPLAERATDQLSTGERLVRSPVRLARPGAVADTETDSTLAHFLRARAGFTDDEIAELIGTGATE